MTAPRWQRDPDPAVPASFAVTVAAGFIVCIAGFAIGAGMLMAATDALAADGYVDHGLGFMASVRIVAAAWVLRAVARLTVTVNRADT